MADILLVNAPARSARREALVMPPLGLAYLAAVAREAGHRVTMLDAFAEGLDWPEFARRVSARRYDVVGFSGMTPVIDTVERGIRICRPFAGTLVLGGPHATARRASILEEIPELDYAVHGEGEATFRALLEALDGGRVSPEIPGLITREGIGPEPPRCRDLDALPLPARDLLPNRRYRYPLCGTARVTSMITSRGCPYQCIFCDKTIFGSTWLARSAASVLAEIDEAVGRYGVQSVVFYDDLFTLNRKRLVEICEGLLARPYRITWKCEGRVNLADPEVLALMRRAGCDAIAYGVETVHPKGLAFLRKNTTPDQAREAFRRTRQAGIKTMGYFVLGIPVETYEEELETIRFAIEIGADYAQFSVLSPLLGSELHETAKANGWYAEVAAHNINDRDRLRPVLLSANWDEAKLKRIVHVAHRMFYMRLGYILKSAARVRSLNEIANLMGLGLKMVGYLFRPGAKG